MPNVETYRALLAKVEEAKGGSRELDGHLTAAFDPPMDYAGEPADIFIRMNDDDCGVFKSYVATPASYTQSVPPLTTSIDAALALVAEVLPGQDFTLHSDGTKWAPGEPVARIRFEPLTSVEEAAPTLPLAIIAAMLKAKRLQLLKQSETAHVER